MQISDGNSKWKEIHTDIKNAHNNLQVTQWNEQCSKTDFVNFDVWKCALPSCACYDAQNNENYGHIFKDNLLILQHLPKIINSFKKKDTVAVMEISEVTVHQFKKKKLSNLFKKKVAMEDTVDTADTADMVGMDKLQLQLRSLR